MEREWNHKSARNSFLSQLLKMQMQHIAKLNATVTDGTFICLKGKIHSPTCFSLARLNFKTSTVSQGKIWGFRSTLGCCSKVRGC